ncbi:MAG: Sapep family Mn(2+)-dependent dipeptidase [Gemmiger sp.]|nr:Sapep family Mn(2+)-dependent dipeptidase [Gemmiger sp.]
MKAAINDPRLGAIHAFAEQNREAILRDITRLVAVPSVESTPAPGAPFGEGPKAALEKALEIAGELGLATHDADGYIGWAETAAIAPAQKFLATITHTDVVPEGNGWDADPYTVRMKDGWLLGRGVADDKGPTILCLYALKYLKESGIPLHYPVRAILGTNEETGMGDVDYYAANFPMPAFCFTPDAEFPVCNGEKGGFSGVIASHPLEGGMIEAFAGGVAHNAVPDRASCTLRVEASRLTALPGVTVEAVGDKTILHAQGKSGHAATPEGTVNAIGLLVRCLLQSGVVTPAETAYLQVLDKLHSATDGAGLGIAADDGLFTPLTIIGGVITMENGVIRQGFDCRYPTNTNAETLTAAMQAACGDAALLEGVSSRVPFYIDANSPAIQTLISTYNEVTGEHKTPFTMGGGTYARHFPYAVSFGPEDTTLAIPEFAGPMHGANEGAPFEKLMQALEIYILALLRLQEIAL